MIMMLYVFLILVRFFLIWEKNIDFLVWLVNVLGVVCLNFINFRLFGM